jgi:hypothetical protein
LPALSRASEMPSPEHHIKSMHETCTNLAVSQQVQVAALQLLSAMQAAPCRLAVQRCLYLRIKFSLFAGNGVWTKCLDQTF